MYVQIKIFKDFFFKLCMFYLHIGLRGHLVEIYSSIIKI